MKEYLEQYVELLFAGKPDSEDMQQEILQNTLDRYDDLISQGKAPEDAYRLAIAGIGDINELLSEHNEPSEHPAEITNGRGKRLSPTQRKTLRVVAIALYICCIIPLIILSNFGLEILGLCLTLVIVAVATVLILLSSGGNHHEKMTVTHEAPINPSYKTYRIISRTITVTLYLLISFLTSAWHITWIIFLIKGAVDEIVRAIMDLKESKKNET